MSDAKIVKMKKKSKKINRFCLASCKLNQANWFLLSMTNATREYCIGNLLILSHLYLVEWYIWYKMPLLTYILTYLPTYLLNINLGKLFKWGNYSSEETIQGRKLLIIRRFWLRKLFKGGNYSREETIWGNTVVLSTLCF